MKTALVKLQFKLASWLYNQGIIAPQLLEHKKIRVMNDEEMEDREKSLKFWDKINKREVDKQYFFDQYGDCYINTDPYGVDMGGKITIRIINEDDPQYEVRLIK